MTPFRFTPTGAPPVEFEGQQLAAVETAGKRRWRLSLYQTRFGRLVLHIAWATDWRHESGAEDLLIAESWEGVADALNGYDALKWLVGYPPGEAYAAKQARLREELNREWKRGLSELLGAVPAATQRIQ